MLMPNGTLKFDLEQGECLLAFLQSEAASAAVGHWLSLLLKAADTEVTRGHRGSANLRIESFLTLRVLVAKMRWLSSYLVSLVSLPKCCTFQRQ
ncbi:hypothetical protein V6Z11_A08G271700 [Gossypium hirsutum]